MKKSFTVINFILSLSLFLVACSKNNNISSEKISSFSKIYQKGGVVHNELLDIFLDSLIKNNNKLSQKIQTLALKYPALNKANEINLMRGMSSVNVNQLEELRDEINSIVASEVLPISVSYLEQNGFYNDFYSAGINNPQLLINQVVNGIYSNAVFSNTEYVNSVISTNSINFQNFVPALRSLIENEWSSVDLFSKIDALKNSYLSQTTDEIEALAIINGCETAKASYTYWNNSVNTNNWDATILYSFNSGAISNMGLKRTAIIPRSKTDIILTDAIGAVVGVIEGARIGALAGPGGAMVVGITGMILRSAQGSLGDYARNKILDWIGW
jgi:hypothetical protein